MLHRVLLLSFILSLVVGCSTTPESPSEPLRLRVLSYNIHHGRGADRVINLKRLADIIKRADPDLVALQEVDRKARRSGGIDQTAKLGELTGMHHTFAEAMPFQGGGYGNAILSKTPLHHEVTGTIALAAAQGQEPRSVAITESDPWDGPIVVFAGTHLCHLSAETRLAQVRQINKEVASYQNILAILAGDFNFTPDSEPYQTMIKSGWVDAAASLGDSQPTVPADQPTMRIDYVFVRPANRWRVIRAEVLDEPVASDHAPVLVELEYIRP
jgi:endonuclease/exonuclease/phosphatase family metal-dependent hydrolase